MLDNTHSKAVSMNDSIYALFCYTISAVFGYVATVMYLDSNQAFVWAAIGYVLSLLFGWNAHRSTWHPLREMQSD